MAETENKTAVETAADKDAAKGGKKKPAKSGKPSVAERIKQFFKGYKGEMNKVVWYSRKQTIKSTGLVIVCLVVVSAAVSLLDLGLSNLIMWLGSLV